MMSLDEVFEEVNAQHFDGFLDLPGIRWNSRLRSSAGRFIPGSRKWFLDYPPIIEVASYLQNEAESARLIRDVIAHEMIHYWLWARHKPYGHNPEFYAKMKEMGVSRYNPVPRSRPIRYVYCCAFCQKEFYAKKKLPTLACAGCCKTYSGGRYDDRFKLVLVKTLQKIQPVILCAIMSLCAFSSCATAKAPVKPVESVESVKQVQEYVLWITRADGELSCGERKGQPLEDGAKELAGIGVRVLESRKTNDGKFHIQMCGAATGSQNSYLIRSEDFASAQKKGFRKGAN